MTEKKETQNEAKAKAQAETQEAGAKVETARTSVKKQSEGQTVKKGSAAELIKAAENASIELSDEEKAAFEVAAGEAAGKKYKLSDPKTQYGEEGFTLAGEQEKELPADPSDALIARIRSGFIVEA